MPRFLTPDQTAAIYNALDVAARRFDDNAKTCAGFPGVVAQFHYQADRARALMPLFEPSDAVIAIIATEDRTHATL